MARLLRLFGAMAGRLPVVAVGATGGGHRGRVARFLHFLDAYCRPPCRRGGRPAPRRLGHWHQPGRDGRTSSWLAPWFQQREGWRVPHFSERPHRAGFPKNLDLLRREKSWYSNVLSLFKSSVPMGTFECRCAEARALGAVQRRGCWGTWTLGARKAATWPVLSPGTRPWRVPRAGAEGLDLAARAMRWGV